MAPTKQLVSILCLAAGNVVAAAPPEESRPLTADSDFVALTNDLSSPDWPTRKAAAERLALSGPSILSRLEASMRSRDVDPATHAFSAVVEAVESSNQLAGATVEVRADRAEEAIRALCAAPGLLLERGPNLKNKGAIEAVGTFWEVVIDLCRTHDWDVSVNAGGSRNLRMAMVPARDERQLAGPVCVTGPAVVVVRELRQTRHVDFAAMLPEANELPATNAKQSLRIELEALLEPRYQIGTREFVVHWSQVATTSGKDLLDEDRAQAIAHWSAGRLRFGLDLAGQGVPGGDELNVAGTIRGSVGGDLYDVELPADDTEAEWIIAGEPVMVRLDRGPDLNGNRGRRTQWQFHAALRRQPDAPTQKLILTALAGLELVGPSGELMRGATRTDFESPMGPQIEIDFVGPSAAGSGRPTARCELPRRMVWLELPFEFDGLPMP